MKKSLKLVLICCLVLTSATSCNRDSLWHETGNPPSLNSAYVKNDSRIVIKFSDDMYTDGSKVSIKNVENYEITNNYQISSANILDSKNVELTITPALQIDQTNTITVNTVVDINGNLIDENKNNRTFTLRDVALTHVWTRVIGGPGPDSGMDVKIDNNFSSLYITGSCQYSVDFNEDSNSDALQGSASIPKDNIFLAKIDIHNNYIWSKFDSCHGSDYSSSVAIDRNSNVFIGGRFAASASVFNTLLEPGGSYQSGTSISNLFVTKFNTDSNNINSHDWSFQVGNEGENTIRSIKTDSAGNFYVVGLFCGTSVDFEPGAGVANMDSSGYRDIFFAKYDSFGNHIWSRQLGCDGESESGYDIAIDEINDCIYVTGTFGAYYNGNYGTTRSIDFDHSAGVANRATQMGLDMFVAKYSASTGDFLTFAKAAGSDLNDYGNCVVIGSGSSIYVVGSFEGTTYFGSGSGNINNNGGSDIFITKYDAATIGEEKWTIAIGGTGNDIARKAVIDKNGDLIVIGTFQGSNVDFDFTGNVDLKSSKGDNDIFILKIKNIDDDDIANIQYGWSETIGSSGSDNVEKIDFSDEDNFDYIYITGSFQGNVDFGPYTDEGLKTSNNNSSDVFVTKYLVNK